MKNPNQFPEPRTERLAHLRRQIELLELELDRLYREKRFLEDDERRVIWEEI